MIHLKHEFKGATSRAEFLRKHLTYCLLEHPDQIRNSDKIHCHCCECDSNITVSYDKLHETLFCIDCELSIGSGITMDHVHKLQSRIKEIQMKLLTL